jgi:hypothetical protein|tara:strand:+ start:3813 stop:4136 length:324 start_codon:yes stop_codon:yes gene_type:complete
MATPIKWEDADFKWELAPTEGGKPRYTWDDVVLVEEALGGGGDMGEMPWTKWEDDKKKRLIKLICKVQGRTYKETKEIKDIKITTKDIKILAEKVLGIEVITENIKF